MSSDRKTAVILRKDKKALIVVSKLHADIKKYIPTAQECKHKGKKLLVIPHRNKEVICLRNLGVKAPIPIVHYYDWPGEYKPFSHQIETAAFLTLHNRGLVLNDIGTAKTLSVLWAADYLISVGEIKRVLIVAPLSTLERVWADTIFNNFFDRTFTVLYGQRAKRKKLLNTEVDFYIINHDGLSIILDHIKDMFDLIIIDEAAVYRNSQTNRYNNLIKFKKQHPKIKIWPMTGTPTPTAPTDAWSLAKLIDSKYLQHGTQAAFKWHVMKKISEYRWEPRKDAANKVKYILRPAIRFSRDECLDLPDTIYQTRKVVLSADQKQCYKLMLEQLVIQFDSGEQITAVNQAVKLQKLVQICCGVVYDDKKMHIKIDCTPRINLIKEVLNEIRINEDGQKTIVFVPYIGVIKLLAEELAKHWTVAVINGAVPAAKRNVIFHNFQNTNDPRILIAHPATMAHGLTLTAASNIIWAAPIASNEQYVQANGRVERPSKRYISNVIHIEATGLENEMYQRLKSRQKFQGLLLDLIQQYRNRGEKWERKNLLSM